jgi:3-hydroxyisobutyrate dehydrogenase
MRSWRPGAQAFVERAGKRRLINMATTAPSYSKALEDDIHAAGGYYVEAPVSGSRKLAETGQLVAMLAGEPDDIASVPLLLAPMCRDVITCGQVPGALYRSSLSISS